jgi:hypothetical protein
VIQVPLVSALAAMQGLRAAAVDGMSLGNYSRVIDLDYNAATSTATVLSIGLRSIAAQDLAMSAKYDNVTVDVIP